MTTTKTPTLTPSPTAKTRDGKTTREAILVAALRLMPVHGYHATSLDDVLRESGVGKGNFYYQFRSKEDLGFAILDQLVSRFVERTLEPCFADPESARLGQIRCFLDRVLEAQRKSNCVGGCFMGNLACELSDVHEGFRQQLAGIFDVYRDHLAEAIRRGQQSGRLRPDADAVRVAQFLVGALEGAILLGKVTRDITVIERCVEELKVHLALYRN